MIIIALLVWVVFFYGLFAITKKIVKRKSIKLDNIENITYCDQDIYPDHITKINNSANYDYDHDYTEINNEINKNQKQLKTDEFSKLDLISEIKNLTEEDASEKRNRAILIGKYLNINFFGEKIYILDNIPQDKILNATKSMNITYNDVPLALIDGTTFGSCKDGIVISLNGIYWKESLESSNFISWYNIKTLQNINSIKYEKLKIIFGNKNIINFSSFNLTGSMLFQL